MVFLNYTIKKMMSSVSTWVTLILAILPTLILSIISAVKGTDIGVNFVYVCCFTLPLPAIFITYKSGEIFRDEIENNTLLSLQAKPITKKAMIAQGFLTLFLAILSFVFLGIIVPGIISIVQDIDIFINSLLISITEIILLSIFAATGLRLSISLKGKSFVGIMIGAIGTGFYLLIGLSLGLRGLSRDAKTRKIYTDTVEKYKFNKTQNGKEIILSYDSNQNAKENLDKLYDQAKSAQKYQANDYIEWFNPASHWIKMFGTILDTNNKDISENSLINAFTGDKSIIDSVNWDKSHQKLIINIKSKKQIPNWYPFVIWIPIGILLVGWSYKSLQKKNIA